MADAVGAGAGPVWAPVLRGVDPAVQWRAVACLARGWGLSSTVRLFNWTGDPLAPRFETCVALPIHGGVIDVSADGLGARPLARLIDASRALPAMGVACVRAARRASLGAQAAGESGPRRSPAGARGTSAAIAVGRVTRWTRRPPLHMPRTGPASRRRCAARAFLAHGRHRSVRLAARRGGVVAAGGFEDGLVIHYVVGSVLGFREKQGQKGRRQGAIGNDRAGTHGRQHGASTDARWPHLRRLRP